jgi:hypothetical protein
MSVDPLAPGAREGAALVSGLQAALQLAEEYGFPVFPCHPDKRPYTAHGLKDASTNIEQVASFWERWPSALIGVLTGRASKLLVVDIDPDGAQWYAENFERLTCARIHKTRRGHHLLYRMPETEIRNSAGKIAPGVDVRGEGGYAIWWPAHGLEAVGSLEDISEPPVWLVAALIEPERKTTALALSCGISEGQRNETLFREAAKLRRLGHTPAVMLAALRESNRERCFPPLDDAELQSIARSAGRYEPATTPDETEPKPARSPLDWSALAPQTPPERQWAIEHWLGMGHVTLMSGPGGIGKTGVAQALGSCLALRREYLDWLPAARRVLMWACEDDANELWRRQAAIASWLGVPLSDFAGHFYAESYDGRLVELAGQLNGGQLVAMPMLKELREQIGDYKADVVILDNIARLFAGNENDRHSVTSFVAMLTAAATPTNAAVLLLGHPAKATGSEYSGSTAWEGSVRSRLYLGSTLPDAPESDPDAPPDDDVRYLCRRKANYSARDWRRIRYINGVMVPEAASENGGKTTAASPEYATEVVARAVRKLASMEMFSTASRGSPNYLPKLARNYKLTENLTDRQFVAAMREMQLAGRLADAIVGKYPNRTAKHGLTIVEATS